MTNLFSQYVPVKQVNQYVGAPIEAVAQAATAIQGRYDTNIAHKDELDIMLANMGLADGDEYMREELKSSINKGLSDIIESERWQDASYLLPQMYKEVIAANPDVINATKSYQNIQKAKAIEDQIKAKGGQALMFRSTKGHSTIKKDPETGEITYDVWEGIPETKLDYDARQEKIFNDMPKRGGTGALQASKNKAFLQYISSQGITNNDVKNYLGEAFVRYQGTDEYIQQKKMLTSDQYRNMREVDADNLILAQLEAVGRENVGVISETRYVGNPDYTPAGSGNDETDIPFDLRPKEYGYSYNSFGINTSKRKEKNTTTKKLFKEKQAASKKEGRTDATGTVNDLETVSNFISALFGKKKSNEKVYDEETIAKIKNTLQGNFHTANLQTLQYRAEQWIDAIDDVPTVVLPYNDTKFSEEQTKILFGENKNGGDGTIKFKHIYAVDGKNTPTQLTWKRFQEEYKLGDEDSYNVVGSLSPDNAIPTANGNIGIPTGRVFVSNKYPEIMFVAEAEESIANNLKSLNDVYKGQYIETDFTTPRGTEYTSKPNIDWDLNDKLIEKGLHPELGYPYEFVIEDKKTGEYLSSNEVKMFLDQGHALMAAYKY